MPTTTAFDEFLNAEQVDEDDYEAVLALHCLTTGDPSEPEGSYSAEELDGGRLLLKGWSKTRLLLGSESARAAFTRTLEGFADKEGFEGDVLSWAGYKRAMDNPNA